MGKHAVVVVGPAGSGKSTLCRVLGEHYRNISRSVHIANFDPAAEDPLAYDPSFDLRDLISLEDAMEGKGLGPNGGLVFCMEYLMENTTWLREVLEDYTDDFLIIDMPGQIELMAHIPVVPAFIECLQSEGYFVASIFLLDAMAVTGDTGKFIAGCMMTLTAMINMECPCIPLLSKCDLLPPESRGEVLDRYCRVELDYMKTGDLPPSWAGLSRALSSIISDFSLVSFTPLDISDVDNLAGLAQHIDDLLQVADDADVCDRDIDE